MFGLDPAQLLWLIPPSILVAFLIFIIKIFGKIISDFNPYTDDRKYMSELEGFLFLLTHIIYPSFFAALTYYVISTYTPIKSLTWIPLIITFSIGTYNQIKFKGYSDVFFEKTEAMEKTRESIKKIHLEKHPSIKKVENLLYSPIKRTMVFIYILVTFSIFQYFSENWILISFTYFIVFLNIIVLASLHAMSRFNLFPAKIYLNNSKEIEGKIIKITDKFVRMKKGNSILLIPYNNLSVIELYSKDMKKPKFSLSS
jgi:hypothetical protein